jgi:hypothetical protein
MTRIDRTTTVRRRNLRTGRPELWQAYSADGIWAYLREESPGTPWIVPHIATDRWVMATSLPKARRLTAWAGIGDVLTEEMTHRIVEVSR